MLSVLLLLILAASVSANSALYQLDTKLDVEKLVIKQSELAVLSPSAATLEQWRSVYVTVDDEPAFISSMASLKDNGLVLSIAKVPVEITKEDLEDKVLLRLQKRSASATSKSGTFGAQTVPQAQRPFFDFSTSQYLSPGLLMAFISVWFVLLIGFAGMSMLLSIQTPTVFEKPVKSKKQ